jgi:CRP-like cAMP-binding protein
MDADIARDRMTSWARAEFGKLVQVRDVSVVRKTTGRLWSGELFCATREGDVLVGEVCVDEIGNITQYPDVDAVVDALVSVRRTASERPSLAAEPAPEVGAETDFSDLALEGSPPAAASGGDDLDNMFDGLEEAPLRETVHDLVASGERDKLLEARRLLPQLLASRDDRGQVLYEMADLEFRLGDVALGVDYVEAAAREFADVADIASLERLTGLLEENAGIEALEASAAKRLLDRSRARTRPIGRLADAPLFVGLSEEEMFNLEGATVPIFVGAGQDLLREGDPATMAFVVKSGVLSVRLETPEGGARIVRSCFPGDFIGESSVLGTPGCTCTATVRAEISAALWRFEGSALRALCTEYAEIGARIESAQTLHRLDSFLSMHEVTSTLDAAVRDQLLGSIDGFARVRAGDVLSPAGEVPRAVYLVVEGRLEYRLRGAAVRACGPDSFAGLRDTLHELPLEGEIAAALDGTVVRFDPERLKRIAAAATPEVAAVLEKME